MHRRARAFQVTFTIALAFLIVSLVNAPTAFAQVTPAPTTGPSAPSTWQTTPPPSPPAPPAPSAAPTDTSAPTPPTPPPPPPNVAPQTSATAPPPPPPPQGNQPVAEPVGPGVTPNPNRDQAKALVDKPTGMGRPQIRVTTWDLNLDGAFGRIFDNDQRPAWFLRARAGILHVRDDLFFQFGVTYDVVKLVRIDGVDATNFGFQAEVMHIQYGVWAQVGAMVDFTGNGGVMAGAGWSLFGVEFQARNYDQLGPVTAFYGKVRIPVSFIYHALTRHDL